MKWLSFLLALAFVAPASSATREEIMRSRYFKYGFCIERGPDWKAGGQGRPNRMEDHKLASAMN